MGGLGEPASAATVINNIFRNYEHRWIYDFDEMRRGRRRPVRDPLSWSSDSFRVPELE